MLIKLALCFNFFAFIFLPNLALAQFSVRADHVQVSVLPISQSEYGVHYKLDPEWHVYWKNPGDSGAAPKFEITGANLKKIHWPYPHRLPVGDLTNYGYDNEVLIPLEVEPDESAAEIIFNLEWLVCKVECVPGFAEFKIPRQQSLPNAADQALYERFKNAVPKEDINWPTPFVSADSTGVKFKIQPKNKDLITKIQNIFIYPENGERFKTQNPKIEISEAHYDVTVPLSSNATAQPTTQADVLTIVVNFKDGTTHSFVTAVEPETSASALLYGILFAFIGGLILNLMPCVFPVLSLKAISFLNENEASIRRSAWTYTAGVVLTFLLIGGVLTLLRLSGQAVGWGFQLQSPWLVYLLSLLFFIMALNFWGFFEIGNALANSAYQVGRAKFFSGSFGTGVLAVIVASPCTAPFMGSALGLTLLLPAHLSLLIFLALGLGMALPMILISYFPQFTRRLPRSGAWMENVKKFMAFPMLLTCLWLIWVLEKQKGSDAVFIVLLNFVLLTLFTWLIIVNQKKITRLLLTLLLLGTQAFAFHEVITTERPGAVSSEADLWQPYDAEVIAEKRKTQAVFIDFTASWCITCQVNKKNVLRTEEIQELFKAKNVFLVQADWTNQDAKITQALADFGRNSVPLYVFYDKQKEPVILSEILTKQMIINLFNKGE